MPSLLTDFDNVSSEIDDKFIYTQRQKIVFFIFSGPLGKNVFFRFFPVVFFRFFPGWGTLNTTNKISCKGFNAFPPLVHLSSPSLQ